MATIPDAKQRLMGSHCYWLRQVIPTNGLRYRTMDTLIEGYLPS